MAVPAEYIPGAGKELVESCLENGVDNVTDMTVQMSEPRELETLQHQPLSVSEAETSVRASTITAMPLAQTAKLVSPQSAGGQYDHVLWNLGKPSKIRPTVSSRQNIPAV